MDFADAIAKWIEIQERCKRMGLEVEFCKEATGRIVISAPNGGRLQYDSPYELDLFLDGWEWCLESKGQCWFVCRPLHAFRGEVEREAPA